MFTTYRQQTLFSAEVPVKDGQLLETNSDLVTLDTSGLKCSELSEKTSPLSSFMKMLEAEFQKDFSTKYRTTWKVKVTKQRRSYSLLRYSVRRTKDTACSTSAYWPTPAHSDDRNREPSPTPVMTGNGTYRHLNAEGEQSQMRLSQVVKMWDTPKSSDWKHMTPSPSEAVRDSLMGNLMQLWSTPRASIMRTSERAQVLHGSTLSLLDQIEKVEQLSSMVAPNFDNFQLTNGHYLNPAWEELLMGLPPGYLDLTRLQTFMVSQQGRAATSIRTSRRAQQRKRAHMRKNGFKHSVTLASRNNVRRFSAR